MKAVIQRVSSASVSVDDSIVAQIEKGLLILFGVEKGDQDFQAIWMADKIVNLRLFNDEAGKMNRDICEVKGSLMVVSQFTIAGNCNKGKRPSFDTAAAPEEGKRLYDFFVARLKSTGIPVETGIFQADMQVSLLNDGPVTFILEH